jgi:dipicolinate synthase subunit A
VGPILDFQVTVIGGDARQITVAGALTNAFRKVKIYGHPQLTVPQSMECILDFNEALAESKVVLLPIGGMDENGLVWGYKGEPRIDFGKYLTSLHPGTLIVTGSFTNHWLEIAESMNLRVLQYADNDEIAILNSIPTAEGTLQLAMEELPITIHGSNVIIIGLGRVGISLTRVFKALGAFVTVTARRKAALARATEMGCSTILLSNLAEIVHSADLIINTVPALVINDKIITRLSSQAVIIDLASSPGGTDFETAKRYNIKAILAPGLPGLVAPKTAGQILANTLPKLIIDIFKVGGELE